MTRHQDRPFVRVYHDDLQRDYEAVWDNDQLLATWLRLLVVADKQWPAPGELPRSIRPRVLASLAATKIVELLPKHRFTIRGLSAERQRRVDAARAGAAGRWNHGDTDPEGNAEGNADGNADGNANRIPPRNPTGNPSRGRASESAMALGMGSERSTDEDAVLVWLASVGATVQPNGNGHHKHLVTLVARQGADAVIAAMKARYAAGDRSQAQLIYGAANELEPIHRPGGSKKGPAIAGDIEERIHAFDR